MILLNIVCFFASSVLAIVLYLEKSSMWIILLNVLAALINAAAIILKLTGTF